MALSSTIRTFSIALSDVDRGIYDTLELKVAQHPSESAPYLITRVLAYALEYAEGVAFSAGLASTDQPPVWQRDLTGRLEAWIDVGTPSAPRLHKASKAADRVAVYCHKRPAPWLRTLAGATVYNAAEIALFAIEPATALRIADTLSRRVTWQLTRTEGTVYLDTDSESFTFTLERLTWPVDA
ncbi:MAG: hypothetical protein CL927_14470 [Deltaproteobacteria bacterium]|nr:hypothetical protein [Deltaproteobacteria bacterium]HCH62193.1 hypothetical protein [Deltaproteobacteria bacterium]